MENIVQIDADYIELITDFPELIENLKKGFSNKKVIVPLRHHHDFPNPETEAESTLLLMPAWHSGHYGGVKMVTISPENSRFDLPAVQGSYMLMNTTTGEVRAILEAKSLTAKRTAATSALASTFLSRENSTSLLMIGTGALSTNLIRAHASVRPIDTVYVWGRNPEKAEAICEALKDEVFNCCTTPTIEDKIGNVDIVSCATLSKTPLILGKFLKEGQHVDLVGAYRRDMREADDEVIQKVSVFVDSFEGLKESGDIFIPMEKGILNDDDIKGNLFSFCSGKTKGRTNDTEITLFKSVGHALEDLVAASYYYEKFTHA